MSKEPTVTQEAIDRFYWQQGRPCCAGCDWWHHLNSLVGECRNGAPVGAAERWAMIGITGTSMVADAGQVMTPRDHHCGYFNDTFDWSSLPPAYQRRVGVERAPRHG